VGLSDENARDWLSVAAGEVGYIPADILADATAHARKTCDHHSKVIPAIIAYADREIAERTRFIRQQEEYDRPRLPEPERWTPKPGELDDIKARVADQVNQSLSTAPEQG
jgi:hypothetical protein